MRVVVFGAGGWGQNYVRELVGKLVAVIEPDTERASYINTTYDVPVYPELPDNLGFDGAIVVTPPESHVSVALPLLMRGKYVMIEKPLATNTVDAIKLLDYPDRCMSSHLYMYHPVMDEMREWVYANELDHAFGRRTCHGPIRPWQNAMWDLCPHDVYMFNYLFGKSTGVDAVGGHNWVSLNLRYGNTIAHTYASWLGNPKVRAVELVATNGERFIFDDIATVLEISPLRRLLDVFLSGSWERCTVDEGYEVVNVLEKAMASMLINDIRLCGS